MSCTGSAYGSLAAQESDPLGLNLLMSDTVGVLWRAASGTVDPWTKKILVNEEAAQIEQAQQSGFVVCACACNQANQDVTNTLTTFTCPTDGSVGADPEQFWCGVKRSWNKLTSGGKSILWYLAIALVLLFILDRLLDRR